MQNDTAGLINIGEAIVMKIGGVEVKQHLENRCRWAAYVVNTMGGNLIINVKETRVAVSREMAQK
ncbi:MAG: ferrous iron transport protein A [Oscillospiraceae bacterium]